VGGIPLITLCSARSMLCFSWHDRRWWHVANADVFVPVQFLGGCSQVRPHPEGRSPCGCDLSIATLSLLGMAHTKPNAHSTPTCWLHSKRKSLISSERSGLQVASALSTMCGPASGARARAHTHTHTQLMYANSHRHVYALARSRAR